MLRVDFAICLVPEVSSSWLVYGGRVGLVVPGAGQVAGRVGQQGVQVHEHPQQFPYPRLQLIQGGQVTVQRAGRGSQAAQFEQELMQMHLKGGF